MSPRPKAFRLPVREMDLTRSVVEWLRTMGFVALRQNVGQSRYTAKDGTDRFVKFGFAGLSDVLGILPGGRFLAVETKVGRNTATGSQASFLAEVEAIGGIGILAYSLDDVSLRLKKEGYVR